MTLSDAQRRGRRSKRKGDSFEREVVSMIRDAGWEGAQRNYGQSANGGADVRYAIPDVRIECKKVESFGLPAWWRQVNAACLATDVPLVVSSANFQPVAAHLRFMDWLALPSATWAWTPMIVGARASARSEFLALWRSQPHPLLLHPLEAEAMVTLLFEDLLPLFARDLRTAA